MSASHGYGPYSQGCRCDVCRAAKAAYIRRRRADARATGGAYSSSRRSRAGRPSVGADWRTGDIRYVASGVTHGTRYAYEERGCRCPDCTLARATHDAQRRARRGRERQP